MKIKLENCELMNIAGPDGETYVGGSQEWYEDRWHKMSGCGPVAASNLIWCLTRRNGSKEQYLELMREMYTFVKPGIRGVNTSGIFTDGIMRYASKAGLQFNPQILEIPKNPGERPDICRLLDFITSALRSNAPVAFLNLSNGTLQNLENWHWVTIISLDDESRLVDVSDHGKTLEIDISEWLKTTRLGGALIYLAGDCRSAFSAPCWQ